MHVVDCITVQQRHRLDTLSSGSNAGRRQRVLCVLRPCLHFHRWKASSLILLYNVATGKFHEQQRLHTFLRCCLPSSKQGCACIARTNWAFWDIRVFHTAASFCEGLSVSTTVKTIVARIRGRDQQEIHEADQPRDTSVQDWYFEHLPCRAGHPQLDIICSFHIDNLQPAYYAC